VRTGRKQLVAALPGILEDPDTDLSGPLRVLLAQLQWVTGDNLKVRPATN
jgi:hypothetical protein